MLYFYMGNAGLESDIHALFIVVNLGFLFVPKKLTLIRYSTLFYFFLSGFRELNSDWLSGKSLEPQLHHLSHLSIKGLEWVAALDILFRWALPPLLFSVMPQQFSIGVLALIAFLAAHYWFLHDFQSIVLIFFVFSFVLDYFERKRIEQESMYQSYAHPEPSRLWWPILFALFVVAQTKIVKRASFIELIKIKGPASSMDCRQLNFAIYQDHIRQLDLQSDAKQAGPLHCQQKLAEASARTFCDQLSHDPGFRGVSTFLLTRSLTEPAFRLTWQNQNVCAEVAP